MPRVARTRFREWVPCDLPDGLSGNSGVQSPLAKFFAFPFGRNRNRATHSIPHRGAFRDRHGRRGGMRWTRRRERRTTLAADGEVVWS